MSHNGGGLSGYARLYGPLAVAAVPLAFLPILADETITSGTGTISTHYGTLWETAARSGGSPAVIGLLLIGVLVALLVAATFGARSVAVPIGITVTAALIVVMLATKPGAPGAQLTTAGNAGLGLAVATVLLGVANLVHLRRLRSRVHSQNG